MAMTMTFRTRRLRQGAADNTIARRLSTAVSSAEVLGAEGIERSRSQAARDKSVRDARALIQVVRASAVDPTRHPPDPRLIDKLGAELCMKHRVLPWRETSGRVAVLATSQIDFLRIRDTLTLLFGPVHLALIDEADFDSAMRLSCHKTLMRQAEFRTSATQSCRDWDAGKAGRWGGTVLLAILACMIVWPGTSVFALCVFAVTLLILNTALKVAAGILHLLRPTPKDFAILPPHDQLPVVTVLVPLFRERDIAGALVKRLSRLDYPADKLDVCLVLEADDGTTQEALADTSLPDWMRAVKVPLGTLQTKPRALNYALNFAKGSIVGVYDAEDAPDPDQIKKVVNRFARTAPNVACLQGRLDFYNTHSNWLARCFTIEYATWFRIILPGLERMGLVIPLGGTTLFFRRDLLEHLGGWDAHNVTEDADLGIRLARHGYRTEILDSTTQEEANARAWPWVKQRSRWLKGYAITYSVHMRNPVRLWRDLGTWRFLGAQLLFAGTISQFVLAPLLWSFWLMMFGIPHPLDGVLSQSAALTFAAIFLLSELIGITIMAIAVISAGKPDLVKWTPTLHLYFPLAALAAYKGVLELATKPFYWDKTTHGIFAPTHPPHTVDRVTILPPTARPRPLPHPVAAE